MLKFRGDTAAAASAAGEGDVARSVLVAAVFEEALPVVEALCAGEATASQPCDVTLDDDDEFDAHIDPLRCKILDFTVHTPVIILSARCFSQAAAA